MLTAKVFQSGNSQVIRIPKEVQTTMEEFNIKKIGEAYILFPKDDPWFELRSSIGTMPPAIWKTAGNRRPCQAETNSHA